MKAKNQRVSLRTTQAQKTLLSRAAEIKGTSFSDFVLESACRAAEHALLDQRLFFLDEDSFARFQEALERPTASKPEILKLFREKPPWEQT